MADAKKSTNAKTAIKDNRARDWAVHSPGGTDGITYSQSAAQASIPQYSRSNHQDNGGDAIPLISKWSPSSSNKQRTKHKSEEHKGHLRAYGIVYKEENLLGLTPHEQAKSPPCADASNFDQHDLKRQWDAMPQAERALHKQPAPMNKQDYNKRRKTNRKRQPPLNRLGRSALENEAMNSYWEAAASSAIKKTGKTPALGDSMLPIHPGIQSTLITDVQLPQGKARKSISAAHELSIMPYHLNYHLGPEPSQLDGSTTAPQPWLAGMPGDTKSTSKTVDCHRNKNTSSGNFYFPVYPWSQDQI